MDYYQIGALKVFTELGQLIEEDEKNKIKFMDLPTDIIQNNISKYLLEDKQINKIFHNKEDILALEGSPARREKARVREEATINRKKEALEAYEKAKKELETTNYETIKIV